MALTETGQVWHEARFLTAKTKSVEMVLMKKLISQPNGTEARGRIRFQPVEWIETGPLTLKVKERREPACESNLERSHHVKLDTCNLNYLRAGGFARFYRDRRNSREDRPITVHDLYCAVLGVADLRPPEHLNV